MPEIRGKKGDGGGGGQLQTKKDVFVFSFRFCEIDDSRNIECSVEDLELTFLY